MKFARPRFHTRNSFRHDSLVWLLGDHKYLNAADSHRQRAFYRDNLYLLDNRNWVVRKLRWKTGAQISFPDVKKRARVLARYADRIFSSRPCPVIFSSKMVKQCERDNASSLPNETLITNGSRAVALIIRIARLTSTFQRQEFFPPPSPSPVIHSISPLKNKNARARDNDALCKSAHLPAHVISKPAACLPFADQRLAFR